MPRQRTHTEDEEFEPIEDEAGSSLRGARVKKLRTELKACQEERLEYLTGWQRARADLINERAAFQKRDAEKQDAFLERILNDILPVLDSFDMAFAHKEAWEKVDENWRKGIEHIYQHLLSVLEGYGVRPFMPIGEIFNPNEHESIDTELVDEKKKDGIILEVRGRGYRRGTSILRPAKVVVGALKSS